MRKFVVTAVLVAAVIFFLLATLPPRPVNAVWTGDAALAGRTAGGAYHVHTTRSDGAADRDAIAAAAARAGLQFVIFTDHGDGTRAPEPPAYVSGVLCLDGVEISTNGGHYTAIGMTASPYPLGGDPSAVVEDVARLGGFGFSAHPDSGRPELAWTEWEPPVDGIEWLNADSEWRDESRVRLFRSLVDYVVRPGPALASLLDRPVATLARWDRMSGRRRVVALAGHDAHGGIGRGVEDVGWRGIPMPGYAASFATFSNRVVLDAPLSLNAEADAHAILASIRAGRVFTAIDAIAAPALLDLRADGGRVRAEVSRPEESEIVLFRDGVEVARSRTSQVEAPAAAGAFRVEVQVDGAPGSPPVPWLLSNAVYAEPRVAPVAIDRAGTRVPSAESLEWHVERDPESAATVRAIDGGAGLAYRLGPAERGSHYTAIVTDLSGWESQADGLAFRISGARPMRVSVQVKSADGLRWGHSVYVAPDSRDVEVWLDRMRPLDGQGGPAPALAAATAILFVVDLINARPGEEGHFDITGLSSVVR